jgi:hypothetical protein
MYPLSVASFVLGAVGLLLFFMPVLGIPFSSIGLLFGIVAFLVAIFGGPSSLRWSVLGTLLCVFAFGVDVLIGNSPQIEAPPRKESQVRVPPLPRWVPPPADPRIWLNDRDR